MIVRRFHCVLLAMILSFGASGVGAPGRFSRFVAADWPQLLGPNRDGQAPPPADPLHGDWKNNPPKIVWRVPAAAGYAGAAIVGNVVFAFDRTTSNERLTALDLATGKSKWQATWKANYRGGTNPDNGPRAVPCVTGNKVICYGAAGDLVCIDGTNGKLLWQRALRKDFNAEDGYFGAGCSPLVIGERVIVNVGGKSAGVVAVALATGKDLWQATSHDASYASPIAVNGSDQPSVLVITRLHTVLLRASDGKLLGQVDFGARGPTVNAATPIALNQQRYFLTASYNVGAKAVQVNGTDLVVQSADRQLLASQYNTPVLINGILFGSNGREDMGAVTLRAIDAESMEVLQDQPLPGPTHLIAIGNQLLMLSTDGTLQLGELKDRNHQVLGSYPLVEAGTDAVFRALPALSNNLLVVRSSQEYARSGEWICIQLP